jgi:hypothetical protein
VNRLRNTAIRLAAGLASALALGGCTAPSLLLSAAGVATDTSVPWAIVKHVHQQMTDGDPVPCAKLNSVQRVLTGRCGEYRPGSIEARDIAHSGMQVCPLAVALREPRFWPAVPELLDKGAQPEACAQSPLVDLAQAQACPDFRGVSAPVLKAFTWLAEADLRAVRHDVVRMLSCPSARDAGLDSVLITWSHTGALQPDQLGFGVLGALHPSYLDSAFARGLEASGHTARAALGGYDGTLSPGFEEALRTSDFYALDWWLQRAPELVRSVPPTQGNQQPWIPLARVLVPTFLRTPATQPQVVEYLLAHGANPRQRMPFDPSLSVIGYAKSMKSPMVAMLESPPVPAAPRMASNEGSRPAALAPAATAATAATIGALPLK